MKQSVVRSLSEKDTALLLETRRRNMETLDEEQLLDLHARVRRARNKHSKNYRRRAAERVRSTGTRGGAKPSNQRNRDRAEALEDALARVSRRLATVARRSATALRVERLAAATGTGGAPRFRTGASQRKSTTRPADRAADKRPKTAERKKRVASSAAAGARRQARKDNG